MGSYFLGSGFGGSTGAGFGCSGGFAMPPWA